MKMIKCDRCGKTDAGEKIKNFGTLPWYTATITQYMYSDVPDFYAVDLCNSCQSQLDEWINKFMESLNGN